MDIDLRATAQNLMELIANSIYEREVKPEAPFFFNSNEVSIVENWLQNFVKNIKI